MYKKPRVLFVTTNKDKINAVLGKILRHDEFGRGREWFDNGWLLLNDVLQLAADHGTRLDKQHVLNIIKSDPLSRFALDPAENYIRANYGHTKDVGMLNEEDNAVPPRLYVVVSPETAEAIKREGLKAGARAYTQFTSSFPKAAEKASQYPSKVVLVLCPPQALFNNTTDDMWLGPPYIPKDYCTVIEDITVCAG